MRKQIDIVISNPRESINCYVSELLEARQISERSPSEKREFNFFENYNDDYFLSVDRPQ